MKKTILTLLGVLMFVMPDSAQVLKQKIIDEGGSGQLKAVAVKEAGLPDFVIYRPQDMNLAHAICGEMPLLMFANGGCMDTSIGYERMLTEIASHGYVVCAIGEMQDERFDRKESHTPSSELKRGLDWMIQQSITKGSDYYQNIDTAHVAAAGHSCGGAQVLANAADPRLKTSLILNAGMGDVEMADADKESLKKVHGPILYITGGPADVAYQNAKKDYERIHHIAVAWADHPASGHGGTYGEKCGGDYGRMVIDWLDWQFKGKKDNARIFLNSNLKDYAGWSTQAKNFKQRPGKFISLKAPCKLLKGITERDYSIYLPGSYEEDVHKTYPVLYLLHGGGGAHTDYESFHHISQVADSLIDCGAIQDLIIITPEGNQQNMMYFNAEEGDHGAPDWKYEDFFFQEFIPYIEKTYRVRTDKGGRAIGGFSMGGGGATVFGVHHPEMFCMVYDISGYLRSQPLDFLKNDPSADWRQWVIEQNNPIRQIENSTDEEVKAWRNIDWKIAVGDRDFTLGGNMALARAFRQKNIPFSMHVDDGEHNGAWVQPHLEDALKRANKNFESLWIQNGDRSIYGIISKPRYTGEKQPIAIISHGFNGTGSYGRVYFENLNSLGYQVYTFDFPCGSVNSRSDNNTMNMSVIDEKNDLKAIVRYFQQQPDVDPDNIVLIGESQGGFVSAMASAEMPKEIKATILVFPALCIPANWEERYPTIEEIPDTTNLWGVNMGRRFFLELRDINIFKMIKKYKNPVLIVQGDKDAVVLMEDSKRAVNTYKNARLHVIPGAGHGFKPEEQKISQEEIRKFLVQLNH